MCGRYAFYSPVEAIREYFSIETDLALDPRYNIAPTQDVPVIRLTAGVPSMAMLYWGLVPFWSKEKSIGNRMINARAETLAEKPSFRAALKSRRCLILANGFYEWQKTSGPKQPHYICMRNQEPMVFAGLWERWEKGEQEQALESCTIITTTANKLIAPIHHRMPVILDNEKQKTWLSDTLLEPEQLRSTLLPAPSGRMLTWPVSRGVNSPGNQGPDLIQKARVQKQDSENG